MHNRRTFFATAASGLAWLLGGSRPAVAISSIAYAHADMVIHGDYCYDVTRNGHPLKRCREANATEGWAVIYASNSDGSYRLTPDKKDIVKKKVYGRIVITARRKDG
jgi:hypothetical protein